MRALARCSSGGGRDLRGLRDPVVYMPRSHFCSIGACVKGLQLQQALGLLAECRRLLLFAAFSYTAAISASEVCLLFFHTMPPSVLVKRASCGETRTGEAYGPALSV